MRIQTYTTLLCTLLVCGGCVIKDDPPAIPDAPRFVPPAVTLPVEEKPLTPMPPLTSAAVIAVTLPPREALPRVIDRTSFAPSASPRSKQGHPMVEDAIAGSLLTPTVIERPPAESHLACDEAFGPVCIVQPYETLDEAIALANGTRYGLQAGIFTRDVKTALRAGAALEFGGVTVNETPSFRADQMPYGGVKESGNTKEGPAWAVREMTAERLVVQQL